MWWEIAIIVLVLCFAGVALFCEQAILGTFLIGALIITLSKSGVLAVDLAGLSILTVIYYMVSYLVIGICWSLFKYKKRVEEIILIYNGENRTKEYLLERIQYNIKKQDIAFWILYFPISVVKFLLQDFVNYLIEHLGFIYKRIAISVVNKTNKK